MNYVQKKKELDEKFDKNAAIIRQLQGQAQQLVEENLRIQGEYRAIDSMEKEEMPENANVCEKCPGEKVTEVKPEDVKLDELKPDVTEVEDVKEPEPEDAKKEETPVE